MKDKLIALRLPHYLAAGGTTFAVEYLTFLTAYYIFDLSEVAANTVSFGLALIVNFLLNRFWVFNEGAALGAWHKQTIAYLMLAFTNYMITNIGLYYLVAWGLPAFAIKLFFVCVIAVWNFLLFKKVIFKASA